jgi:hypothetical protein
MADQSMQPEENRMGSSDHEQHRTPPGEGSETTLAEEQPGPAEFSIYDGKGNETVAVVTEDETGFPRDGTGETREEARKEARDPDVPLGEAFGK